MICMSDPTLGFRLFSGLSAYFASSIDLSSNLVIRLIARTERECVGITSFNPGNC